MNLASETAALRMLERLPVAVTFTDGEETWGILGLVTTDRIMVSGSWMNRAEIEKVRAVPTDDWDELQDAGHAACLEDA